MRRTGSCAAGIGAVFASSVALAAGGGLRPPDGIAGIGAEVLPAASLNLLVRIERDNPHPARPPAPLDTLGDLARALHGCWSPPPLDRIANPPDVIFDVSFRRNGSLFGRPRIIQFSRSVTEAERGIYYESVARALDLCSSLPFTDGLGGAVAGRTFRVVLQDRRNQRQALR
ncbi:MAG: hypothetical protein HC900_13130 [Methylacidiphilales bacterium]|nr:hypothetical protein [Candidatus Methylacidiphilales bacterium]